MEILLVNRIPTLLTCHNWISDNTNVNKTIKKLTQIHFHSRPHTIRNMDSTIAGSVNSFVNDLRWKIFLHNNSSKTYRTYYNSQINFSGHTLPGFPTSHVVVIVAVSFIGGENHRPAAIYCRTLLHISCIEYTSNLQLNGARH